MKFEVAINVMPLKDLLDPQGKAVLGGLANLGIHQVEDVRVGKRITLSVEAGSADEAKSIAEKAYTFRQSEGHYFTRTGSIECSGCYSL